MSSLYWPENDFKYQWLTYQPATLTEDGIEVIIDCTSGEIRDSRVIPHN